MPVQVDFNTLVVLVSCGATVGAMLLNNKNIIRNIEDRVASYKLDMEKMIVSEKRHAVELVNSRLGNTEKDIDEIFPRLRVVEDSTAKNCYGLKQLEKNCIKHKIGGTS